MEKPIDHFWSLKLAAVRDALEANNFAAYVAADVAQARRIVFDDILPKLSATSVSWGGSMTFKKTGLYDDFLAGLGPTAGLKLFDTYAANLSREEVIELRRLGLHADLFVTGANAITAGGQLVNLDMIGNRVASLTFGPRHVLVLAGRNKIVDDLNAAFARIKEYAAPVNAMRLDKKTPCVKTGQCEECKSPDRICNTWTITEKSFPKGRTIVVLIDEDLGL